MCKKLLPSFSLASLGLALWTVVLFYNITESAAFNGQFLWVIFLLVEIIVSSHTPVARAALPVEKFAPKFRETRFEPRGRVPVATRIG